MLKLPKDPGELTSLLNALARLTLGNGDFKNDFRAWLESENERIAKLNKKEKEKVLNRWQQGAGQVLDELFKFIDSAEDRLKDLEQTKKRNSEV